MKNILIIETGRDNQGCTWVFISDINEIPDVDMKQAVVDAINGVESQNEKYYVCDGVIFTQLYGYYFSNLNRVLNRRTPFQVEHIIQHILDAI